LEADGSDLRRAEIEIINKEEAMIQPDNRSSDPSLDLQELLTRLDNDCELLRDLLRIFKEEFPCLLQSLQEAEVRGDMKGVEVTAHTIKGMLANVSFARAAASAACLERMGQQSVTQGLPEELASLEQEASLAVAELEAFCTEMIR
jgi:HPt (histidine-containing phosphotransfer) domain-containing protein